MRKMKEVNNRDIKSSEDNIYANDMRVAELHIYSWENVWEN